MYVLLFFDLSSFVNFVLVILFVDFLVVVIVLFVLLLFVRVMFICFFKRVFFWVCWWLGLIFLMLGLLIFVWLELWYGDWECCWWVGGDVGWFCGLGDGDL